MATNPTTPTPEQLREDAAHLRRVRASVLARVPVVPMTDEQRTRAALALEEQAARLEAPAAELRGWGVMRPDGTLESILGLSESEVVMVATEALDEEVMDDIEGDGLEPDWLDRVWSALNSKGYRAVPVRLTTEGATAQEGESDAQG